MENNAIGSNSMENTVGVGQEMAGGNNGRTSSTSMTNTLMNSDKSENQTNQTNQKFTQENSNSSTLKAQNQNFDTEAFKGVLPDIYSKEDAEAISQYAKGLNLSEGQTQKFADVAKDIQERTIAKFEGEKNNWEKSLQEDTDFGGVNFDTNVGYAKLGLKHFDNNGEVGKLLSESGYGSHPAVVKFFQKVGRALNEDKVVGIGSKDNFKERPLHDRLYK